MQTHDSVRTSIERSQTEYRNDGIKKCKVQCAWKL